MKTQISFFISLAFCLTLSLSLNALAQFSQKQNLTPLEGFSNPWNLSLAQRERILESYSHLDLDRKIATQALEDAVIFFELNKNKIPRHDLLVVIDYSKPSWQDRFYVIDLETGKVEAFKTSHGKGSDPTHTGRAQFFSNTPDSNMTSLGFYLTGHDYDGQYGKALKMHGLSESNSKAFDRAIVIHGAGYVNESENWVGRSQGCPALDFKFSTKVIEKIKEGALIYSWAN
ncbi:MAG: murein L,D-transpeptidase catalytic domain family protein [Proteobacteria bacterium]|jgi:hypothetical protein|nr:murein L,D-transpeptidase catalytic domain family protein [Pseudomonadota bacterium]